jgi:Phage integrase, N-terminal SAM-like domain
VAMPRADTKLVVERRDGRWVVAGLGFDGLELVNDFLGYLADRNYAVLTVRAYAFDLLHFARWMVGERLSLEAVDTDVLLRYLAACRAQLLPRQHGGNVFSLRDGRSAGYAPRTVNRRLATLSSCSRFARCAIRLLAIRCRAVVRRGVPRVASEAVCSAIWRPRRVGRLCGCVSHGGCPVALIVGR